MYSATHGNDQPPHLRRQWKHDATAAQSPQSRPRERQHYRPAADEPPPPAEHEEREGHWGLVAGRRPRKKTTSPTTVLCAAKSRLWEYRLVPAVGYPSACERPCHREKGESR